MLPESFSARQRRGHDVQLRTACRSGRATVDRQVTFLYSLVVRDPLVRASACRTVYKRAQQHFPVRARCRARYGLAKLRLHWHSMSPHVRVIPCQTATQNSTRAKLDRHHVRAAGECLLEKLLNESKGRGEILPLRLRHQGFYSLRLLLAHQPQRALGRQSGLSPSPQLPAEVSLEQEEVIRRFRPGTQFQLRPAQTYLDCDRRHR